METESNKHGTTSLVDAVKSGDVSLVDLLIRLGARDDANKALLIATKNGDNHLISKLLALRSFPDPEYKINKKAFKFFETRSVSALGTVTFSSMFPTTPVMINWHSLRCLPSVQKQWITNASISHNVKLKLNLNSQSSALIAITRLDLSNNKLSKLPLCIFQLASLKILNLAQNLLEIVPEHDCDEQFGSLSQNSKMKKSRSFTATSTNCNGDGDFGWYLPMLEELYLQDNRLETVPSCVFQLPSLLLLDLSNNKLRNLPYSMWTAPKLRELNLSLNLLRDLPRNVSSNSSLTVHTPKSNCSTPETDIETSSKSDVDLESKVKDEADPNLKPLPLKHLNYWTNNVEIVTVSYLDEEFEKSHQCKLLSLNLSHNGFTSVPENLSCLAVNLTRLNFSYNCLSRMGCLKLYPSSLKHLDLSHNQITEWFTVELGTEVDHSPSCFNANLVSESPKSSPLSCPKGVHSYCMHKQHNRLDNLRTLILSHNQLTSLCIYDNSFGSFEDLELDSQDLKATRTSRILYPNCSMLDLSNNILREVPAYVSELSNLSVLNLTANADICRLPPEMGLLSKLWNLRTKGCNLQEPLKTMMESKKYKTMDIIGYLKSILEDSKPYARMKLMVVGVQGIGKTSLLEQLRTEGTGSYRKKPPEHWAKRMGNKNINIKTPKGVTLSTVGVDVCDWTYEKREKGKSSFGSVSFRTWDFGGQKEYYATHQYFLSRRSLYLVVWKMVDGEKGVDSIQQWLVNIQARAPNSPVIIVGTHYDLMREYFPRFYSEDLQLLIREKFINVIDPDKCGLPRVVDSIEISTKTRYNIKALCNLIYDTVFDIRCPGTKERLLEQKIPATYLALEDVVGYLALERRLQGKDPVLRAEKYKAVVMEEMRCRFRTCFRDVAELHQATAFLHDNGVLLHYDDATLKDLYFLDPQWLCDLLAHVVTIREINPYAKNGIMKTEDLKLLFKSSCASSDAKAYIVNLLNKFEVALTWDSRTLLIPSLLPKEEHLQAGLPGCDVRIPVRSRGWALRNSFLPTPQPSIDLSPLQRARSSDLLADPSSEASCNIVERPALAVYRLVLMAYFPSGFWSRLMTRVLADDIIIEIVRSYFIIPKLAQNDPTIVSLFNRKAEWMCWQSGMALRHFDSFIFRVKEVIPSVTNQPFDYTQPVKFLVQQEGTWSDVEIQKTSILEIYLPNQAIHVDTNLGDGTQNTYIIEPNQECIAKLLALTVDHIDTLLEDWYPSLGTRFVHTSEGKFLVTRLIPCTKCLVSQVAFTSSPNDSPYHESETGATSKFFDSSKSKVAGAVRSSLGSVDSTASNDSGVGNESVCSSPKRSVDAARRVETQEAKEPVVYCFMVEECIYKASQQENISCVVHGQLRLRKTAPDTVFADLGDQYLIKSDNIKRGKMLGRGAFGFVFRASVKQRGSNHMVEVAMKMLQPMDPGYGAKHSDTVAYKAAWNKWQRDPMQYSCKAYCTARQELNILLTLKHSHIVQLVGVCTNPLALILRLAPLGALDTIVKDYRRSGVKFHSFVLQKVFLQVAKALEYLHQQHIIYRDLKSENVLVWTIPPPYASPKIYLSSDVKVDVKLADYGISRSTLPSGAKGFGGTEGFMAPEIMRYNGEEEYTEKVDCFSFSMFMYELISLHMPFEGLECVKDHILEGGRPTLTQRDIVYPSHILDLMTLCWSHLPKDRPNASQIVSIVSAPEFIHMLDAVQLSENHSFLCSTVFPSKKEKVFEAWISRSGKQFDHLSYNDNCFVDYNAILSLKQITVTAVCYVPNSGIWLGDSKAVIYIYSTKTYKEISSFRLDPTDDTHTAVHEITFVVPYDYVAISTSNGRVWLCQRETLHLREIGNNGTPFMCYTVLDIGSNCSELWCGQAEGTISIFTITDMIITSQEVICLYSDEKYSNTPMIERLDVFNLVAEMPFVWSYLCTGSHVYQWSVTDRICIRKLDTSKLVPCSESLLSISIEDHLGFGKSQISSMAVRQGELYVGTTGGCLIIVETETMRPITVFRPYEDEIKAILPFTLKLQESDGAESHLIENRYFLSIGKGFRSLISRYINMSEEGLSLTIQKGVFAILWKSGNWFI